MMEGRNSRSSHEASAASNFGNFARLPCSRWSPEPCLRCRLLIIPDHDGYRPNRGEALSEGTFNA